MLTACAVPMLPIQHQQCLVRMTLLARFIDALAQIMLGLCRIELDRVLSQLLNGLCKLLLILGKLTANCLALLLQMCNLQLQIGSPMLHITRGGLLINVRGRRALSCASFGRRVLALCDQLLKFAVLSIQIIDRML